MSRRPLLFACVLLFILTQTVGPLLFPNAWGFSLWRFSSYGVLGAVLAGGLLLWLGLRWKETAIESIWSPRTAVTIGLVALAGYGVLFSFNSILMGGGNIRIAQVAQTENIILRWFEWGSLALVEMWYRFFELFPIRHNVAGVYAWRAYSVVMAALAVWGALRLARLLSTDRIVRLFIIVFCVIGGHALPLLGFVGWEAALPCVSIWFALNLVELARRPKARSLLLLWGTVAVGVLLHASLLLFVPAAFAATLMMLLRTKAGRRVATMIGLAMLALGWLATYIASQNSLELQAYLVLPDGKLPFSDYGLLSPRHLADVGMIILLALPFLTLGSAALWSRDASPLVRNVRVPLTLAALGGLAVAFITDATNGIVFDHPRLAAYLAPAALFVPVGLAGLKRETLTDRRWVLAAITLAIVVPTTCIPNIVWIRQSERYVTHQLDQYPPLYRIACLAYRDAYFTREELKDADRWEWLLPSRSPEILNLRGILVMATRGEAPEALNILYRMIAQNPYWTEPRITASGILGKMKRPDLAKAQLDTALMIAPYRRDNLMALYAYHRDRGDLPASRESVLRALALFPGDPNMMTDWMIIEYRLKKFDVADSLAGVLMARDSLVPFPNLIRGFLAERKGDIRAALLGYERFVARAKDEPETPQIRARIDSLKLNVR